MNGLIAIIGVLSNEEKQEFLLQQRRKNRRNDVKNEQLFKLINDGEIEGLDLKIYGKPSRNSFHALCKRLQDSLIDFIASKSFAGETSEELEILKLLLASRIFFEKKQYKIGFRTLNKAEKIALQYDIYSILNEIYHTKIQYTHLNEDLAIDEVIKTSELNMMLYRQDFHLNQAYALIKEKLKDSKTASVKDVIQNTFSRLNIEVNQALSYKSLYQLMEITAQTAKLQNDFHAVAPFMFSLYGIVKTKKGLQEKHRYYHIRILNLLAITHFRRKDFEESLKVAMQMESEMRKDKNSYYKQFTEKLTIIKALNYNYSNHSDKAISLLNGLSEHSLDAKILIVMCLFQQERFSEVYEIIKNLNHSDNWYEKKMGWIWVLKKNLIEVLVLTELDKLDLVLTRFQNFKRKFSKQLQKIGEERVLTFIELISKYYENPKQVTSKEFKNEVESSFKWLSSEQEDIFVMSFYAWLKAKMENEDIYKITLQLVGTSYD